VPFLRCDITVRGRAISYIGIVLFQQLVPSRWPIADRISAIGCWHVTLYIYHPHHPPMRYMCYIMYMSYCNPFRIAPLLRPAPRVSLIAKQRPNLSRPSPPLIHDPHHFGDHAYVNLMSPPMPKHRLNLSRQFGPTDQWPIFNRIIPIYGSDMVEPKSYKAQHIKVFGSVRGHCTAKREGSDWVEPKYNKVRHIKILGP